MLARPLRRRIRSRSNQAGALAREGVITSARFGFHIGPFYFSQRLGRTQAQKRAAAKAKAERQDDRDSARRAADRARRSFKNVPACDVTHGADGSVSLGLDPPGFSPLHLNLENWYFYEPDSVYVEFYGDDGFPGLREGDRVHGTASRDGSSPESLRVKHGGPVPVHLHRLGGRRHQLNWRRRSAANSAPNRLRLPGNLGSTTTTNRGPARGASQQAARRPAGSAGYWLNHHNCLPRAADTAG